MYITRIHLIFYSVIRSVGCGVNNEVIEMFYVSCVSKSQFSKHQFAYTYSYYILNGARNF